MIHPIKVLIAADAEETVHRELSDIVIKNRCTKTADQISARFHSELTSVTAVKSLGRCQRGISLNDHCASVSNVKRCGAVSAFGHRKPSAGRYVERSSCIKFRSVADRDIGIQIRSLFVGRTRQLLHLFIGMNFGEDPDIICLFSHYRKHLI